ncbi:hypothetical protein DICA2_C04852 [Diutina catenulata]
MPEAAETPHDEPPAQLKQSIVKTVEYVVKNGDDFEQRIRESNSEGKFDFLEPSNQWHEYYQRTKKLKLEGGDTEPTKDAPTTEPTPEEPPQKLPEPLPLEFITELPTISAKDLAIIKLAAKYVAANGAQFEAEIADRFPTAQFEFLQPQHPFHGLYTTLQRQYRRLLDINAVKDTDDAAADPYIKLLRDNAANFTAILPVAEARAQWTAQRREEKAVAKQERRKRQEHFASIPWNDFVVVGHLEFTAVDDVQELAAPLVLKELEYRSIDQKEAAAAANTSVVDTLNHEAVPKALRGKIREAGSSRIKKQEVATITCPLTGKQVPAHRFDDHIKALLRDPNYTKERESYVKKNFSHPSNTTTDEVFENIQRMVAKKRAMPEGGEPKRLKGN